MAKAAYENSTSWISLARALGLFVEVYRSPHLAERLLWEALFTRKIRRIRGLERGRKRDVDPGIEDDEFFKRGPSVQFQGNLQEGWVCRIIGAGARRRRVIQSAYLRGESVGERVHRVMALPPAPSSGYAFYAIEVTLAEVIATFPANAQARLTERMETARGMVQEVEPLVSTVVADLSTTTESGTLRRPRRAKQHPKLDLAAEWLKKEKAYPHYSPGEFPDEISAGTVQRKIEEIGGPRFSETTLKRAMGRRVD